MYVPKNTFLAQFKFAYLFKYQLLILLAKQLQQALKQSTDMVKLMRLNASHTPQEYRACGTWGEVVKVSG
jgi:hypothetical protein